MESKKHTLIFAKINKDTFEMIRNGQKKIETRAYTVKYHEIKAGDTLVMSCDGEKFEKKVTKATCFLSISDLLATYPIEHINPTVHSEEELTKIYYSFPDYKEKIRDFGLLAFELE
jgi:ASC-1-like (ASCH) protein